MSGTVQERITAAAVWLDGQKSGWFHLVDTEVIDMMDQRLCIAGQVFAEEGARTKPKPFAIDCDCFSCNRASITGYEYLRYLDGVPRGFAGGEETRQAWVAEILARREEARP